MTYVTNTHNFFKKSVYYRLTQLAGSPLLAVNTALDNDGPPYDDSYMNGYWYPLGKGDRAADNNSRIFIDLIKPILMPLTCVSTVLALALAAITAVIHGLALMIAAIADLATSTATATATPANL